MVDSASVLASGVVRIVNLPKLASSAFPIDQVKPVFTDTVFPVENCVELASLTAPAVLEVVDLAIGAVLANSTDPLS